MSTTVTTPKKIEVLFKEMPEAERIANFTSLGHIRFLASTTNTDITRWDILKTFGSGEGNNLISDKRKINKIFTDKLLDLVDKRGIPEMADIEAIPELTLALEQGFKTSLEKRRKELNRTVESEMNYIQDAQANIEVHMARIMDARKLLENILDNPEPVLAIKREIQEVIKTGIWVNPVVKDNFLYLNTATNMRLSEKNKAVGLDVEVDVGQFAAMLDLVNFSLKVIPYKNNIVASGYYHPHIGASGSICWGNAAETAARHLKNFNLGKVLELLYVLLMNYNAGHPYISLIKLRDEHQKYTNIPSSLLHPDKTKEIISSAPAWVKVGQEVEFEVRRGNPDEPRWNYAVDYGSAEVPAYRKAKIISVDPSTMRIEYKSKDGYTLGWDWPMPADGMLRYSTDQWNKPGYLRPATEVNF